MQTIVGLVGGLGPEATIDYQEKGRQRLDREWREPTEDTLAVELQAVPRRRPTELEVRVEWRSARISDVGEPLRRQFQAQAPHAGRREPVRVAHTRGKVVDRCRSRLDEPPTNGLYEPPVQDEAQERVRMVVVGETRERSVADLADLEAVARIACSDRRLAMVAHGDQRTRINGPGAPSTPRAPSWFGCLALRSHAPP